MRIAILGAGYVGLVTGACFAEFGVHVTCIDRNADKIAQLQNGEIPIYEPELNDLVAKGVAAGRLVFDTDLADHIQNAAAVFIAVGTPSRRGDGHADLSYVEQAARDIAPRLSTKGFTAVVTKSTVPVGTCRKVAQMIAAHNPRADFAVCSNPEFLRQGSAIHDFMRPDRVVIGVEDERAARIMRELYRPLLLLETPVVQTDLETAELTKYAGNAFLAMKVAFINEIADLCEQTGADVQEVARGIGLDTRIGHKFLHAGPGFGGSCFPKDAAALIKTARDADVPMQIVETVVTANEQRKQAMAARVIAACGGNVRGQTIAVLGVTFKPNTDDVRASAALDLIPDLQDAGATIHAYDPAGMKEAAKLMPDVVWAKNAYDAMHGAQALVILTEWNEFRALDFTRVRQLLTEPVLVDLRNIYKPAEMAELGFRYFSIGRKTKIPQDVEQAPIKLVHSATRSRQR